MLAETSETLKSELTDRYVVVTEGVPELKRFVGLTGRVKTVNMNGRALVEFNGPADISWYDIDPSYLNVIDAPLPKQKTAAPAESKPAASKATGDKPAAKKAGGMSPLEMARHQGAAAGGAAAPAKSAAPAASGEKKLSPLEMARQQGAAKEEGDAPVETPATNEPAEAKNPAEDTSGLSPLELARRQGAAKR